MDQINTPQSPPPPPNPPPQVQEQHKPAPAPPLPQARPKVPEPKPVDPKPVEPKPVADPALLNGLEEDAVTKMLGPPDSTQLKGTGKILVWHSDLCSFDILMFQDVKTGTWRTLGWQVEDGSGTLSTPLCFGSIKGSRQ